jgi:hypothetical protein
MPRDALEGHIRPAYIDGGLTAEAVSRLAEIPEKYVPFLMSGAWLKVIEQIK